MEKYSNYRDISLDLPLYIEGRKEIRLLLEGAKNVS